MEEVKVIEICEEVLIRLSKMDYERIGGSSTEQLIFPNKFPSLEKLKTLSEKELLKYVRRSEQELRQLFIDVFKKNTEENSQKLFYSIETPTEAKYKFSKADKKDDDKITDIIKVNEDGQSALLDMCVFNKPGNEYKRILNIEFKHGNAPIKDIAKDVLKLMREEQNGAFIFLLNNTNVGNSKGTLNNDHATGVIDKLFQSFEAFKKDKNNWNGNKSIQLIILSLEQKKDDKGAPFLIHHKINKDSLNKLKKPIFFKK